MAKYKSGIGDNEDLMPYKTYGQEDLHFDIKINATGKQIKDVYGYPPIKATYNLYTSCKKDMPIYKEDNYDIDIETHPNFLVDYYIQTLDQDNNVLEKYPSNAPDVRLKNAITKLDGTKELLRLNEIPLNLDDHIGFIYKPTLLLEKLEDISMSDVYNEWVQFDKSTDGANWQYDPENDQIYNLSNQNGISGYYNPNYLNLRDYTIEVKMFTDNADDDMMGFCFRFQDEDNYYSFQWDNGDNNGGTFRGYHGNGAYLFKTVNGNRIVLDYTPKIWRRNTWEDIKIEVKENTFKVYHEGKLILSATDNTFTSGSLGPISMSQPRTYFKNLKVSNINIALQISQKGFLRKSNTENVLLTDKTYKELLTPLYNDYINSNSGSYKIIKYYTETDREYLYFNESIDGNDRIKVSAQCPVFTNIDIIGYPRFNVKYRVEAIDDDNNVYDSIEGNASVSKLDGKVILESNISSKLPTVFENPATETKINMNNLTNLHSNRVGWSKRQYIDREFNTSVSNGILTIHPQKEYASGAIHYEPSVEGYADAPIDVVVQMDIQTPGSSAPSGAAVGIAFRSSWTISDHYCKVHWTKDGLFLHADTPTKRFELISSNPGYGWEHNTWYTMKVVANNDKVDVYINGAKVLSGTIPPQLMMRGYHGPYFYDVPGAKFRNFIENYSIPKTLKYRFRDLSPVTLNGFSEIVMHWDSKTSTEDTTTKLDDKLVVQTDSTIVKNYTGYLHKPIELTLPYRNLDYNDILVKDSTKGIPDKWYFTTRNNNDSNVDLLFKLSNKSNTVHHKANGYPEDDTLIITPLTSGLNDCIPWKKVKIQFVNCSPSSYVHMHWGNSSDDITTNKNNRLYVHTDYFIADNFEGIVQQPIPIIISLPDTEEEHLELIDTLTKDPDKYKVYYKLVNNNPDNTSAMFISPTEENENISVLHGVNGFVDEEGNPTHDFVVVESTSTSDYEVFEWTSNPIQLIAYLNRGAEYEKEEYMADLIVEVVEERAQRWQIETDNGEERSEITYFPEQCSCEEDEEVEIPGKPQKPLCGLSNTYHIELVDAIDLETNTSIDLSALNIEFTSSTINNKTIFDFETPAEIVINSDYTKVVGIREVPWVSNKALESKDIEKQTIIKNQELWTYNIDKSNLKKLFNIPDDVRDIQLSVQTSNLIDSMVVDNGSYFTIVCKRKDQDGVGSTRWYPMIHNGYFYIDNYK